MTRTYAWPYLWHLVISSLVLYLFFSSLFVQEAQQYTFLYHCSHGYTLICSTSPLWGLPFVSTCALSFAFTYLCWPCFCPKQTTCSNSWATAPKACICRGFFPLCGKFIILGYKDKTEGKSEQHQDNKEKKPHEQQERERWDHTSSTACWITGWRIRITIPRKKVR